MSLPREIKTIVSEYEGKIFRIDKGVSSFTFEGKSVSPKGWTKITEAITLPLNLKAGYWHFTQGPTHSSLVETGDIDLAIAPTYTLLFYHQSFDVTLLPQNVALSAERGPPYNRGAPEEIKSELFSAQEVTLTLCSKQEVKLHIKLDDAQAAEDDGIPISHAIDTPYGVKEGDLYTAIAFPIIVSGSQIVRDFDSKINSFLRRTLVAQAEEKSGIKLRLEGESDLHIDNPDAKTFTLLGLLSTYEDGDDEKSVPYTLLIIDREGAMGVIEEGKEPHYLSSNGSVVLQQLRTLSDQLSSGLHLRSYITDPTIKSALETAIATGTF